LCLFGKTEWQSNDIRIGLGRNLDHPSTKEQNTECHALFVIDLKLETIHVLAVVKFETDSTMCELELDTMEVEVNGKFVARYHGLENIPAVAHTMNYVRRNVVPGLAFLGLIVSLGQFCPLESIAAIPVYYHLRRNEP
jgi:hypothetical protein